MSKELEALNKIQHDFGQLKGQELVNCYETIFNGLKRLETIDNSNLSEALEKLKENTEMFDEIAKENNHSYKDDTVIEAYVYHFNNIVIEQALLNSQEQEKVLDVIKEKRVDMWHLVDLLEQNYEIYLAFCESEEYANEYILTQEEFDLVKKVYCGTGNTEGVR